MAVETVVSVEVRSGVAWIRLNRPERMNAVDTALRRQLADAVKQVERDEAVRVVVVTGSGRAFCAGADVGEFTTRTQAPGQVLDEYEPMLLRLRTMPKPVIAALNGVAAGIGASIAMACDIRIAAPEASFVEAFVRIGLAPDGGATWFLPRFVGTGKALEMFFTGDPLSAADAERLGLVNRVVPADQLETVAGELAQRLAAGPAGPMAAAKRAVNRAATSTLEEAMEFEGYLQEVQAAGEDFQEGVAAFLEKRAPKFKGA
jgi:2-(1,2-epoxy-1,2-dihydrophenyl)acetyl-CoA isomerase